MYVHEWHVATGRATNKDDWSLINAWEQTLPPTDFDGWRAVVKLRNTDIHTEPVVPTETWQGGYMGGFLGGYMGGWLGDSAAQTVSHPKSGNRTEVIELAECALRVVKRLFDEYKTL